MPLAAPRSFGAHLKSLREAAGFTQEELATIAGLSVHAISALERGERRRPHVETVRALSAALDLTPHIRDAFVASSRAAGDDAAVDELRNVPLPIPPTELVGREDDLRRLGEWLGDPAARLITLVGPAGVERRCRSRARDRARKFDPHPRSSRQVRVRPRDGPSCGRSRAHGRSRLDGAVLGASDVVTERTGAKVLDHAVRDLRSDTERAARVGLGTERWADAYAAGRSASIDALLQDIDDHDSSRGIAGRAQQLYDVRVTAREVP